MNKEKINRQQLIALEIEKIGATIMRNPLFVQGFSQKHHGFTTVGDHTLNVTIAGSKLAGKMSKVGFKVDRRDVIIGALLHDIGIIGRDKKYKNNYETGQRHGIDSAKEAAEIVPDLTPKQKDIIENHMFPVTPRPPRSVEGVVVTLADKWSSIMELICHYLIRKEYNADLRKAIRKRIYLKDE